ncbi:hypothetical protein P171DRAFT_482949 [Karstenula rhodostoma CBS 690.94]|uniref:Uncharacterized protein n=1 Tax=Karstenula rhodostoma CBS 690.94 TaxID=1392251 RepID=A0A9P4PQ07_9PLEO|nr:hypothetical protein P171DRAFT_482949 [Karstenula rhodostoma CBS 690.94]
MASKRTASAADASEPGTVNESSTPSKRPCHDHNQTSAKGKTADKPIAVKSEDPDSLLSFLTSSDIVTIHKKYDLTLVVGDQVHRKGMKAFRVSSACLSTAGEVFGSMFSGGLSESFKSELLDLAIACDKYFLHDMIKMVIHSKSWLSPHKNGSPRLPVNVDIQDWILIAHYFRLDLEYEYLVNSLAMNLQNSQDSIRPSLYFNNNGKKVTLRAKLPGVVLEKIMNTRTAMLDDIQDACIHTLNVALGKKACSGKSSLICASAAVGMLVRTFHEMDMSIYHSHPAGAPSPLQNSVRSYWQAINQVAGKNEFSDPVPPAVKRTTYPYINITPDYCSWDRCMARLDPKIAVNEKLQKDFEPVPKRAWHPLAHQKSKLISDHGTEIGI